MSTYHSNSARASKLVLTAGILFASLAFAQTTAKPGQGASAEQAVDPQTVAIRLALQKRYPNTKFGAIERTPMAGIWEVWMGANVAYITDDARHFIFGHLYDMEKQMDLTASKKAGISNAQASEPSATVKFADLPLQDAIKTVRGNGARKLAVFSDVDCGYCQQLEAELAKLDNVTVYTFLFPLASLHPQAVAKSTAIWCANNPAEAWATAMSTGSVPNSDNRCRTPIEANIALAQRAGIQGTPFIFFENGMRSAGALDVAGLERRLVPVTQQSTGGTQ
ncbi:DsbC family protein [Rhodoferax sp.]|uniref:DsbC family protein n=1 Tax=Rhodoferax sp. TaxID=50421 RepID=UPI002762A6EC|nr:DsbC family protein [Rhodoferax sp.]